MLRRLNSVHLASNYSSSISPATFQPAERVNESPGTEIFSKSTNSSNQRGEHGSKLAPSKPINPSIKYLIHRSSPFWWFSTVRFKFGGVHLVLPRGRFVLAVLISFRQELEYTYSSYIPTIFLYTFIYFKI
ncbi:hypothetical protein KSP40_PGU002682 [Platanthera guangdongensis]|uniref:Uncharacterized protein n=1 Tax=Platanthera guangdongensis TaxID=2320717 RepID=A0ABR2LW01_9ASPA